VRGWLGIDKVLRRLTDKNQMLSAWIEAIESKGILVAQMSRVPVEEVRGFCIAQHPFPMIVLNGGDSQSARLFTLAHELIHVFNHQDSVCNDPYADSSTESYCNAVAAAVL